MAWYIWALVIFTALNVGAKIAMTGQPKDPREHSPGEALTSLIYGGLVIWALVALATG